MAQQAVDLVRLLSTAALVVVLVFGPGIALRLGRPRRKLSLGFLPLPGLAALVLCACLAWALSRAVHPRIVCAVALAPLLGWIALRILRAGTNEIMTSEERWALMVVGAVLGIAVARSLWSLGPPGELLAGTTFRTLEVGDRSDSRVSFGIVQLIAHAHSPFGRLARAYFQGYTLSDRGPLAGLASAPLVLVSGGRPSAAINGGPWSPFDPEGFMTYRLAMMTFAATAFLSLWTLVRRLASERTARFALLLAAATPFLVHEVWFTWPKLLAASLVLLGAVSLLDKRPLIAGLLVGAGYLAHPVALLSVPPLYLLVLWPPPPVRAGSTGGFIQTIRVPRPQIRAGATFLLGVAACLIAWRLANGSHYTQSSFLHYLTQAGRQRTIGAKLITAFGGHPGPVPLSAWISDRLVSVANTLVPLRLFFLSVHDPSINAVNNACYPFCVGHSSGIVRFFLQYWTALPFAVGIVFFPMLVLSLWRALRKWPWAITATVIVPFVAFAIYWGDADTGLVREGLQVWVLTLVVVIAGQQRSEGYAWLRRIPTRGILALRSLEVFLVAMLPTLLTRHRIVQSRFRLTDIVAVLAMVILCGWLGSITWRERVGGADT